jgi:Flp pilus assembly protein TadG
MVDMGNVWNLVPRFVVESRTARGCRRISMRFVRRNDGATVIEFALVVFPFFALLFAILETALVFFAGQVLETAVTDASRLVMTGQAQKGNLTQAQFKTEICNRLYALFDCQGGIKVDVRTAPSFGGTNMGKPLDANGNVDTSGFTWQPGVQGSIVVVRVAYEWPTFVRYFGLDMADLPNGKRLLMSTSAFRNEPYPN